jgi:capsular exopolysaccharide synthesis family protein
MFDAQEMRAPAATGPDSAQAVPLPVAAGQQTHLLDRLTAVFKHRRIAGSAFALVVTVMMLQSYSTIPIYQTTARLEINDPRSISVQNIGIDDPRYWESTDTYNATQLQVLQSRDLGRRVVERLDLRNHPDFSGNRPRPRDPITLVRQARASLSAWIRSLIAKPAPVTAPKPQETVDSDGPLISAFLGGLSAGKEREAQIFNLTYTHTDPDFAAMAANAVAEEYVKMNIGNRQQETLAQLKFVEEELGKAEQRTIEANKKLLDYKQQFDAISLDGPAATIVASALGDAQAQLAKAATERRMKEELWRQLEKVNPADDSADAVPAIGDSPAVVAARGNLRALEAKKKAMLDSGMGEGNPHVKTINVDIENARALLVAERKNVREAARVAWVTAANLERSFASALNAVKSNTSQLDAKSLQYRILDEQAKTASSTYQDLLKRKKDLEIIAASQANNARVMDPAEPIRSPISPNSRKDLLTAILAGLTLALALAFGIEYLDDSVKTPEDITKRLRLPLLGLVPKIKGNRVPVLAETVPHDFGEAFRSLRTSLVFTSGGESTRLIAVTSSQPLEGKTTTAANLAFALALGGSRVLLVDADMRRPGLHKTIGLQNELGLSHLLTGQSRVREVVQRTAEPNLFAITAGRTPPNPSELLSSERMNQLLANLAQGPFDWVVIDTPPVLAVTDAVIVAQKVAGVVFVIGSEMTRRVHAERALETLQSGRARSIGAVINRVDIDRNKYYYSRYYGYQYKNYYGQNAAS